METGLGPGGEAGEDGETLPLSLGGYDSDGEGAPGSGSAASRRLALDFRPLLAAPLMRGLGAHPRVRQVRRGGKALARNGTAKLLLS